MLTIEITTPDFTTSIEYPKHYTSHLSFMQGWKLDQIFKFCASKGWKFRIVSKQWKWDGPKIA